MTRLISEADLVTIRCETDRGARRLVRELQAPAHVFEDCRQELLVDLLRRLPHFDRRRGSLGAFAGNLVRHRAARLKASVGRERRVIGGSLNDPLPGSENVTRGDLTQEEDGYGALFGQTVDRIAEVDRRLSVLQGLATLGASDQHLCASLVTADVSELVARGIGTRTSLYRRIAEIRLALTSVGVTSG